MFYNELKTNILQLYRTKKLNVYIFSKQIRTLRRYLRIITNVLNARKRAFFFLFLHTVYVQTKFHELKTDNI